MSRIDPLQPAATEQLLREAIDHQQAGRFQEAGERYLRILQTDDTHPEANHQMGRLAVRMGQPGAALAYFSTALDAEPARGQYWLDYIEALFLAGQIDDARQILTLARQQGLYGDEVDALTARLHSQSPAAQQQDAIH
ncbi:MAG: tetratricopeptide repeat protein, partial [Sideroxydans sp.]|nr:tetratricopeptide repeat protein [Sideroxydans sp.]